MQGYPAPQLFSVLTVFFCQCFHSPVFSPGTGVPMGGATWLLGAN